MDAPTTQRMEKIRQDHEKHLAKLHRLWNESLMRWLDQPARSIKRSRNWSRSKYDPAKEDLKHEWGW